METEVSTLDGSNIIDSKRTPPLTTQSAKHSNNSINDSDSDSNENKDCLNEPDIMKNDIPIKRVTLLYRDKV
jgi:hypothetical protein